jgi:cytochrome c oxidase subunit 4
MSEQHVLSVRTNLTVFGVLLALLVLTIAVAYVNLGFLAIPVAMAIATVKALLIMPYFMHVRFSPRLIWIFSGAAIFWLFILLALSFNDYLVRGWIEVLGK